MFYNLVHIYSIKKWNDLTPLKRNVRIFMVGTILYIMLYACLLWYIKKNSNSKLKPYVDLTLKYMLYFVPLEYAAMTSVGFVAHNKLNKLLNTQPTSQNLASQNLKNPDVQILNPSLEQNILQNKQQIDNNDLDNNSNIKKIAEQEYNQQLKKMQQQQLEQLNLDKTRSSMLRDMNKTSNLRNVGPDNDDNSDDTDDENENYDENENHNDNAYKLEFEHQKRKIALSKQHDDESSIVIPIYKRHQNIVTHSQQPQQTQSYVQPQQQIPTYVQPQQTQFQEPVLSQNSIPVQQSSSILTEPQTQTEKVDDILILPNSPKNTVYFEPTRNVAAV